MGGFIKINKQMSPRERAARALCRFNDVPENIQFEGRPMWESFLPEMDAVLEAALGPEDLDRVNGTGSISHK